ncbi:hypothetical protein SAMD00019534_079570 [Acytostelium subglobosum LB1]|uniref:hypothetical protein n=1 Tax=Acytostelium subglobosum LB1 TaxID=1410327 RepID=UPI00064512B3|nr:hypothetical protein SAMD00019534_079570 [Acytostelium subglobosum LB1]GAM24782.1 hypothetical protein SAMD00019534_079570 [Acytostelium subglobosum LB1]|eukprot:XP_012752451.1 hypothetical protein SAMD00019534_079570 [Acytostelium subglobosum LB1]
MFDSWKNWKWIKSSNDELESAEKRIMETITTPFEQKMVKVGEYQINTIKAGKGEPLLLIHGYGAGVGFWCANIDFLAQHYTVYAIDLLGFGRSSRPDVSDLKTSEEAENLWITSIHGWSEQVGLEKFNLLGHSLGGYISTCFTLRHPEKVKSLVLADAWGFAERPSNYEDRISLPFKLLFKFVSPEVPLSMLRTFGPFGQDLIYKCRQDLLNKFQHIFPDDGMQNNTTHPNRVAQYIYHANAREPATGECLFGLLTLPYGWAANPLINRIKAIHPSIDVTLMYGSNTWIDHNTGVILKEKMDNIKDVVIIEDSGHHVYIDNINQFHSSILKATLPKDRRDQLFADPTSL